MLKIAIIVLNLNGLKNTIECLTSLQKLKVKNWQVNIIVVDNNSQDNSVSLIKKKFPEVQVILNKKNLGYAEGNNIGINYTLKKGIDFILLLNNDTLVDRNLLIGLIENSKKDNKIGIASPKIFFAPGHEFHKDRYGKEERGKVIWYAGGLMDWKNILPSHRGVDEVDQGQYDQVTKTDFATGCCILVKREVFEKIGLLDKKYFLYWEDVDICERAKRSGFKVVFIPQSVLWHKNASSAGGAGGNLSVYYQTRNRMLFAFKYATLKTKLAVLKEGIRKLIKGNITEKKAVKDFLLLKFGKMIND